MNITKENGHLVLRLPLEQEISNCYLEDSLKKGESLPTTDNLIGVVSGDEFTISKLIDLDYKNDQQEGMPFIHFEDREDLEEACKICGINIWEHPVCAYCKKGIYGCFGMGDKGNRCTDCENKK